MLWKLFVLFIRIPIIIYSFFLKKDNKKIIFSSSSNKDYDYNSKYFFEYIIKNHKDIECRFVINDQKKREELNKKVGNYFLDTTSVAGILEVLKAGCWVTSAGLPIYFPGIGNGRYILNVWHGVPLKKIALLENNYPFFKKVLFKLFFSINYSSIVTTSEALVPIMAESFGVSEKKIKVLGQPRNDLLWENNDREEVLSNIHTGPLPSFKKIILYVPTYRDTTETILFPFNDFNIETIDSFLSENNILMVIKTHKSSQLNINLNSVKRIFVMNNNKYEDIMQIVNIFDLVITDYSSIFFDYLLLNRPLLFLPYDYHNYKEQRGFNFDYNEYTPGPKPNTQKDFLSEINKLINNNEYFRSERNFVNNKINKFAEGNNKRIFNELSKILYNK